MQMIFIDTWNIVFRLDLLDDADMIMPGDQATVRLTLPSKMPLFVGQQYTLRENKMTVGTGIVTKLCKSLEVRDRTKLAKLDIKL